MTIEVTEEQLAFLREMQNELKNDPEAKSTYSPTYWVLVYERPLCSSISAPVSAFITRKAALDFIYDHGENMCRPFVYTRRDPRNKECQKLRDFFMGVQLPEEKQ